MGTTQGFNAMVGNPPFAGKNTLLASQGERYVDWLKTIHEGSHGNSDLVAHFYRRAYTLLRSGGAFGLLATNTVAQGDTRSTGLRWICSHEGVIYDATRRYKWPGLAAVVVSIVHIQREPRHHVPRARLDGKPVDRVSAFLFHEGADDDPIPLKRNEGMAYLGSNILGVGFFFDDAESGASPSALMKSLIDSDVSNAERIFPFLGGEDINDDPRHIARRHIISFGDLDETSARRWPALMSIVEQKVRPGRIRQKDERAKELWWQFARTRPELYARLQSKERVLVASQTSKYTVMTFVSARQVFGTKAVVFVGCDEPGFCVLQSRVHEAWAQFLGSSMKDDPVYTPSDCFETFPFPDAWETMLTLEAAGRTYYEFRAALMIKNNEGLTDTYNRFHDPDEQSPEILELRAFHDAMDRVVLDAYGWGDIRTTCAFLLEYEEESAEDQDLGRSRRKKKPWRYRWPDETRDEVLARLLTLNARRAAEERCLGADAKLRAKPASPSSAAASTRRSKRDAGPKLPGVE